MAVISSRLARKPVPVPPVPVRKALVAAASSLPLDGTGWKNFKLGDNQWQTEAWKHYDICGELRFVSNWIGGAVSRCRLYVAKLDETGKPGEEVTDLSLATLAETVFGGPANKAEAMRLIGTHLYVPGESYIVAEGVENANEDRWYVVSTSGVKRQGDRDIMVERPQEYGGGWYTLKEGRDLLIRVWTPHPRKYDSADSSVRPALPILREIEQLTKHVFAQIDSRLAGAGLLLLPDQLDFPKGDEDPEGAAGLMAVLQRAMAASLSDRADPSSLVPIMAQVPGEFIDKVRHITFETPLASEGMEIRDRALRRLALSLDVDPEILLGKGDTNHWSAWQLEESTIKVHIEPLLTRLCDALTTGYLRAALTLMGQDPDAYTFWYDTSPLAVRPNRQADGLTLFEQDAISEEALRQAGAWSEDDAPDDAERARRLATKLVLADPTLIHQKAIQQALGVTWALEAPEPPQIAPPPGQERAGDDEKPREERALPERASEPESAAQAALLMGAHMVVQRSLEMAGKRLLTRANRDRFHDAAPWELHTHIRVLDPDHAGRLLDDTFSSVGILADRTGVAPGLLRDLLSTYCRELMIRGASHDIDLLETFLEHGLHAECQVNQFCRNPLHPGPCKGWKKTLKRIAPGVHDALESARKEKLAKKKAAKKEVTDKAAAAKSKVGDLKKALAQAEKDAQDAETTADAQKAFKEQSRIFKELEQAKREQIEADAEVDALVAPATRVKQLNKQIAATEAKVQAAKDEYKELEKGFATAGGYDSPGYKALVAKLTPLADTIQQGMEESATLSSKLAALLAKFPPKPVARKKGESAQDAFQRRIESANCCQAALDEVEVDLAKLHQDVEGGKNYALGGKPVHQVRHGIQTYKGSSYRHINGHLRSIGGESSRINDPDKSGQRWGEVIEGIDAAHATSALKRDTELWRGMENPQVIFGGAWNDTDVTGLEWEDHGYGSATVDKQVAKSFAGSTWDDGVPHEKMMMRLLAPAGTPAVKVSGYEFEAELLLRRGSRYRVVADHGIIAGARQLDVELVS